MYNLPRKDVGKIRSLSTYSSFGVASQDLMASSLYLEGACLASEWGEFECGCAKAGTLQAEAAGSDPASDASRRIPFFRAV